jgi:hypothetical protein
MLHKPLFLLRPSARQATTPGIIAAARDPQHPAQSRTGKRLRRLGFRALPGQGPPRSPWPDFANSIPNDVGVAGRIVFRIPVLAAAFLDRERIRLGRTRGDGLDLADLTQQQRIRPETRCERPDLLRIGDGPAAKPPRVVASPKTSSAASRRRYRYAVTASAAPAAAASSPTGASSAICSPPRRRPSANTCCAGVSQEEAP